MKFYFVSLLILVSLPIIIPAIVILAIFYLVYMFYSRTLETVESFRPRRKKARKEGKKSGGLSALDEGYKRAKLAFKVSSN
jgi:hypothetical protein